MKEIKITTLAELKDIAIAITHPTKVCWPQFSKNETILPVSDYSFEKCYDSNNSTIAFVSDYILYVIPSMRIVRNILVENGFTRKSMYVPFSNWDYPVEQQVRWETLRQFAHEEYLREFVEDCNNFADKHNFGVLTDDLLEKCFEMPSRGLTVSIFGQEDIYFPLVNGTILDCIAEKRIGRYCTNNGTCVFVYRNGKTYVTRSWDVVKALHNAGYIKGDLAVPFSNGETIKEPAYAVLWKKVSLAS